MMTRCLLFTAALAGLAGCKHDKVVSCRTMLGCTETHGDDERVASARAVCEQMTAKPADGACPTDHLLGTCELSALGSKNSYYDDALGGLPRERALADLESTCVKTGGRWSRP